jgi:hypothetical protein
VWWCECVCCLPTVCHVVLLHTLAATMFPFPSSEQVLWSGLFRLVDERGSCSSSSSSRATGWLGCIFVGVAEWAGGRIKQEVSTAKVVQCYPWARQAEGDRDKARRHRTRQGGGRGLLAGWRQGDSRVAAGWQGGRAAGRQGTASSLVRVGAVG